MLIACEKRDPDKISSRDIRRAGKVPAVLYGKEIGSVSIAVPGKEALKLFRSGDLMVDIKVEGLGQYQANLRGHERDTLTGVLKHLSFFQVEANKPIDMSIPIKIVGNAHGAKAGGVVNHHLSELDIVCLPRDAVNQIEIDVSKLELDGQIHLEEIKLPKGLEFHDDMDLKLVVIDCYKPKEQKLEPDNAPVVEPAEGAEGEAKAAGAEKKEDGKSD